MCIADAAGIQLQNKGDLEYFYEGQQQQQVRMHDADVFIHP